MLEANHHKVVLCRMCSGQTVSVLHILSAPLSIMWMSCFTGRSILFLKVCSHHPTRTLTSSSTSVGYCKSVLKVHLHYVKAKADAKPVFDITLLCSLSFTVNEPLPMSESVSESEWCEQSIKMTKIWHEICFL